MWKVIAARLQSCGLELHPEKTKIVYCKDDSRKKLTQTKSLIFWATRFGPGAQ